MAASGLLPVQGVHPRRHAPRHVSRARGEDGARPVGEAGRRVHAPVRGVGGGDGPPPARRHARRAIGRDRHPFVAVRRPLRRRGEEAGGLHGCGGRRHRRDRPRGPRLHHRGRRSRGARCRQRDAGQGPGHGRTVRAWFHGPQRGPGICASGRL